jgi:hypothetical protein
MITKDEVHVGRATDEQSLSQYQRVFRQSLDQLPPAMLRYSCLGLSKSSQSPCSLNWSMLCLWFRNYLTLAAFPRDALIPIGMLSLLWGPSLQHSEILSTVRTFANRHLLHIVEDRFQSCSYVQLHSLLYNCIQRHCTGECRHVGLGQTRSSPRLLFPRLGMPMANSSRPCHSPTPCDMSCNTIWLQSRTSGKRYRACPILQLLALHGCCCRRGAFFHAGPSEHRPAAGSKVSPSSAGTQRSQQP